MRDIAPRNAPPLPASEWMKSMPAAMRFILQGDTAVRAMAAPIWGVPFSEEPCRGAVQNARATLWLGPDEYLLLGLATEPASGALSEAATADALERALGELPHSLVTISHRQFALEVSGSHAATILSGACPLDLDIGEFPIGMCTRTVLAKADIVLWRTQGDAFRLEVWRSFSGYVTGLLSEIAREFYGG